LIAIATTPHIAIMGSPAFAIGIAAKTRDTPLKTRIPKTGLSAFCDALTDCHRVVTDHHSGDVSSASSVWIALITITTEVVTGLRL
jgi:hypothetical protein